MTSPELPPAGARFLRAGGLALLERSGVVLLLAVALYPRTRDMLAPFDRQFEGFQGAFFATAAVNYERLGVGALGGYPVVNFELSPDEPTAWYAYANHPPTVPLLAWASVAALAPAGWSSAWREHRAPEGIEGLLRLPFLVLHVLGLLALWSCVRAGAGAIEAMIALALCAALPASVLYATLVNYETPAVLCALLGCGAYARWVQSARRRDLALVALFFLAGGAVTFAPLFFVPPLVLQRLLARRARQALVIAATGIGAGLAPLAVHGALAARALASTGRAPEALAKRVHTMLAPLFDGSVPLSRWGALQLERMDELFSAPILVAAGAGLALVLVRGLRRRGSEPARAPLAAPLFLGGLLVQLAFYRHTSDDPAQDTFLLNLAPGVCALAAAALGALAAPLARLRAGIAPLVVILLGLCLPALRRADELRWRWRAPGPADDPALTAGPDAPLPATSGARLAELLPPGSAGLYPAALGFNLATFYYAWRTLVPIEDVASSSAALALLAAHGMGDAPLYLVLPTDPPAFARAGVARLRAVFAERLPKLASAPPDRVAAGYAAWLLEP